jgi:ketosteroid isomerase-like protein
MAAKNVQQTASFYADSASILSPGEPIVTGKAAITASWASLLTQPGSSVIFAPTTVDVSGDRAYEIGNYEITAIDKAGKPQTTKAKYVVMRGRQADGTWKVLVDVSTTTH